MLETDTVDLPTQRAGDDVVARAVGAFQDSWHAMVDACTGGTYAASRGVVRARTQLPVAAFNGVWASSYDVPVDEVLDAVDEFAAGDLPWNVQLRPGYPGELDEALAARGLRVTAGVPFMVLTDVAAARAVVEAAGLPARPVTSFADLDAALSLLEQGFGMPPQLTRQLFAARLFFLDGVTTWLVESDGEDVSTALSYASAGTCGVFNVATPEPHRGHGFASVATAQAVLGSGASCAYLQSSPMGRSVYEKLGFVTVETWRQWMLPAYVD